MDGPKPSQLLQPSSQTAASLSASAAAGAAAQSSAHQHSSMHQHSHLHQTRHQSVVSPTIVSVAPLHQSTPQQPPLDGGGGGGNAAASNSEPSPLQAATNQLMVQHTLDILAQVEHMALDGLSTAASFALKSEPDGDGDSDASGPAPPAAPRRSALGLGSGDSPDRNEASASAPEATAAPLLSDADIAFQLHPPAAMLPAYPAAYYMCECASRLLFLSVHWVKQVPAFRRLAEDAQQALLLRSWTALFVLGLAQCAGVLALPTIWRAMVAAIRLDVQAAEERSSGGAGAAAAAAAALRNRALADAVAELQACVQAVVALRLDEVEFAYVKLVALFGMGEFVRNIRT